MASIALKTFTSLHQSSPENSSINNLSKPLPKPHTFRRTLRINASNSSLRVTGRNLRVAVIGGDPAGGCAVETLAKGSIETFLIEHKMDNCKPCGGEKGFRRADGAIFVVLLDQILPPPPDFSS